MRLEGKVTVVTGAASGIGQAIAVEFAREGALVVVDYRGDAAKVAETAAKIEAIGANM